jgi:magnesium transporter
MIVRIFDPGNDGLFREVALDRLSHDVTGNVWIDVTGDDPTVIARIGEEFGFHPLSIEDARKRDQRPKVDEYDDHLFIVLYALNVIGEGRRPETAELHVFLTARVLVTIRREEIAEIHSAAQRWAGIHANGSAGSTAMLFYTIADEIVDGYFPCMDAIGDDLDELEDAVFDDPGAATLERVFRLKRQLVELRRVIAPTRDVFNSFTRRELPLLGEQSLAYFQDVYDHVIRVTDSIDSYRDILASVIDVHLTLQSNQLNQTVRTLTSASIVLMSLALIAGIYGMNFNHMPELAWQYGYYIALGGMALLAGALIYLFRRIGWW